MFYYSLFMAIQSFEVVDNTDFTQRLNANEIYSQTYSISGADPLENAQRWECIGGQKMG